MYQLFRTPLFLLEPERAHSLALEALAWAHRSKLLPHFFSRQQRPKKVAGIEFPNFLGLAAGYDKNAQYIDALFELGFGFVEAGTVVPRPQAGNPKPRVFRIPEARAFINRMGFPSVGLDQFEKNLLNQQLTGGILGINIGKNKETSLVEAHLDYIVCMERLYKYAHYLVVNISSPNTPGLRDMQNPEYLRPLLNRLKAKQRDLATRYGRVVPLFVKLAPDIGAVDLEAICHTLVAEKADGIIVTNSTIGRQGVEQYGVGREPGGLTGAPLTEKSRYIVSLVAKYTERALPIIGCGGIMCKADADQMLASGADLIEIYTGLVYRGPSLIADILSSSGNR